MGQLKLKLKLKFVLLSVLSGTLIALSFQKFNFFCLAWFAFVPLIYCIFKSKIKYCLIYGFITGFVCYAVSMFWMFVFLNNNLNSYLSSFIVSLLLWIYLSLYFVVWSGLLSFVKKYLKSYFFLILFSASLWVVLEFVRTYFLTGFPWNLVGYSQACFLPLIQITDITGIYGISFLIISVNMLLYILSFNNEKFSRLNFYDTKKFSAVFFVILISIVLIYGFLKVQKFNSNYGDEITVGVLQPDIDQYKKWDQNYKQEIINELDKNIKYFNNKAEILVYPESVLPGYLQIESDIKELVANNLQNVNLHLIGATSVNIENNEIYNSVFAIEKSGSILDVHNKNHLVIFGEYIPLRKFLSKFFGILNSLGDFSKGKSMTVFKYGRINIGSTICSENFFPNLTRQLVNNGATLLTNHTNDAWFGNSAAPYQHFVMNIFRAVETRKNIVVCANTGVSAVINCTGTVTDKTKIFEQTNFITIAYCNDHKSMYSKTGDLFAYLCLMFTLICLVFLLFKKSIVTVFD